MQILSLLFSAPSAIRKLVFACVTSLFCAWFAWVSFEPVEPAENIVAQLAISAVLFAVAVWGCFCTWRALYRDLEFGRLLKSVSPKSTFQTRVQTTGEAPVLPERSSEEKIKMPWASGVCSALALLALFQCIALVDGVDGTTAIWLLVLCLFFLWVYRPVLRATLLWRITEKHEQHIAEVESKNILPLDKYMVSITDSNFYRYHAKCLESLKFERRYTCRFYHTFCNPEETVLATLGRDLDESKSFHGEDYVCLTSVAENGQVFQTHSSGEKILEASQMEPKWILQTVDGSNFDTTIEMHKSLVERHLAGRPLLALNQNNFVSFQRYIYEVMARARVKFYNLNQRHFA